jgi:hypothetical protein
MNNITFSLNIVGGIFNVEDRVFMEGIIFDEYLLGVTSIGE